MKIPVCSAALAALLLFSTSCVNAATKINGFDYNPKRKDGSCPKVDQVRGDLEILGQYTNRLRIYSVKDCNQGEPILRAMEGTDWKLTIGLWIEGNRASFDADKAELIRLSSVFDFKKQVEAVLVGSEALYRKDVTTDQLVGYIAEVREALKGAGLESIPVSAAETWPFYSDQLIDAVDFIFVHIFPFWEGKTIDDATDTIFGHIYDIEKIANGKRIIVGETGWPTAGPNYDAAVPSIDNTRTYLNNFVCRANYEKYDYFWFSAIDEGWKPTNNASNVESHWGLLDADFKPKFEGDNWIDCKNYVPNKNSKILRDASSSEDSSSSSDGKHSLHGLSSGASAEGSLESGSESSASTVATTQLALGAMTLMLGAVVNALS